MRLRNQELQDDKKSDIVKWNDVEHKLFEVERQILTTELFIDAGELESVDFGETADILSAQEQREQWEWELSKGIIDTADILTKMDSDRFPERKDALEYLEERQTVTPEVTTSPLLEALTTPV